jgi:glycerol-3-phosphate dehydrogenase subunit C
VTTTYDPHHPQYLDEAAVRGELTRVFDLCHDCKQCVTLCSSFPTLFSFVDADDRRDAGLLTVAQQNLVVDQCFHCKLCYVNCPYTPDLHEWKLDFPRLMLRAQAMRRATGQVSIRDRVTTNVLARTDLIGTVGSVATPLVNKLIGAQPGSLIRKVIQKTTGVSGDRLLPAFATVRFSTWFKNRPGIRLAKRQGRVSLFPTCFVEYQTPQVGQDLARVYERNGVEISLTQDTGCCGAPWLQAGELAEFTKVATKNVTALAASIKAGNDIVVAQPTCGYVLKKDYADYVGGPDAQLVADNTYDAAEYLIRLHQGADTSLDTDFTGDIPATITYHASCHLRAQNVGLKSRDLMRLTGAKVTVVQQSSGMNAMWGLRAVNAQYAITLAKQLGDEIEQAGGEVVTGDCHLGNTAITEQTGRVPVHPLQVIARAYGIAEEG